MLVPGAASSHENHTVEVLEFPSLNKYDWDAGAPLPHVDWQHLGSSLAQTIGERTPDFAGAILQTRNTGDNTAFFGPHVSPDTFELGSFPNWAHVSSRAEVAVTGLSQIRVSAERQAEIANGYVLPDHLAQPRNQIEAMIGYIIGRIAGVGLDPGVPLQGQGRASAEGLVRQMAHTPLPPNYKTLVGNTAVETAFENSLHRATQLDILEHVLRLRLYQRFAADSQGGTQAVSLAMSTEHLSGTGALEDALEVVNGWPSFAQTDDETPGLLKAGLLPSKHQMLVTDTGAFVGNSSDPKTMRQIWPPTA